MLSAQTPPNATRPAASLGDTALAVWRTWRGRGWQGLPCYGQALGMGDFTWMADGTLHKWLTPYTTRPATRSEQDDVWDCLLAGALRIYTRRNGVGVSFQPVSILHEMTGRPLQSGQAD